jgi:hypothetical protein
MTTITLLNEKEMYDIKYNLPISKKDEWKSCHGIEMSIIPLNYNKVELYEIGVITHHQYYRNSEYEGIVIKDNALNLDIKLHGYYRINI